MKQQVFSFKKGQDVPEWVQKVTCTLNGVPYLADISLKFSLNGKLFVLPNGDLVSYHPKPRNKKQYIIRVDYDDDVIIDVDITGAGGNDRFFNFCQSCRLAFDSFKLKNTVKTSPLPMSDPRI